MEIIERGTRQMLLGMWLLVTAMAAGADPTVAFYYGPQPLPDELRAFDAVVVEPDHAGVPATLQTAQTSLFAYVSMGELAPGRSYAKDVPASWLIADNPAWGSKVIDQTQAGWPDFFLQRVIAPLWEKGYRGFFLDTLDSYRLAAPTEAAAVRQQQGLVAIIKAIKARYPEAKLILNRGFEILPAVHMQLFAVAAESLFQGWDAAKQSYVNVADTDRLWLTQKLAKIKGDYRLPVIVIDYLPPSQRTQVRTTADRIKALGFIPWVTNGQLDMLGVGQIEVMPRKVLMLYDSQEAPDLTYTNIHRYAAMPLNHLGYVPEYWDVRQPLPDFVLTGRYAGIVSWFHSDNAGDPQLLQKWLAQQIAQGMHVGVMDRFGFPLNSESLQNFGLKLGANEREPGTLRIAKKSPGVGYEIEPLPYPDSFIPLRAGADDQVLLQVENAAGLREDAVAVMPWGGYALVPYVLIPLANQDYQRWVIDPFKFFSAALRLPQMPVPDTTTENGRRLILAHVDGDGFASQAEFGNRLFAGEVLQQEVLEKYRIPTTISIIQGEIAPNGLHPESSPKLESIARALFALPHVEIASHSLSHPFQWRALESNGEVEGYNLKIPGYKFSEASEITGSINYINSRLAPPGKTCKVFLWTGDCNPAPQTMALVEQAGVFGMNGGETIITRSNNSLTAVGPLGLQKGAYFQVFAPNQNENRYTNLWSGPFYGFQRVIETFELTDRPRRLKPINIYYHAFSATKKASLRALQKVYDWALQQQGMHIYASEYVQKVADFNHIVVARDGDAWLISGAQSLRELRIPQTLGYPDLQRSQEVAGFNDHESDRYVHVSGAARARIVLQATPPLMPYLAQANGRLVRWERTQDGIKFGLQGHLPLKLVVKNSEKCVFRNGNSKQAATRITGGTMEFKTDAIDALTLICRE